MRNFTKLLFTGLCLLFFSNLGIAQKSKTLVSAKVQPSLKVKDFRTTAQKKIDPEVSSDISQGRGVSVVSGDLTSSQSLASTRKIPVNIKCMVTANLQQSITGAGGEIVSSSEENNNITALIPAAAIEKIAASNDVKYISKSSLPAKPVAAKSTRLISNSVSSEAANAQKNPNQ